METPELTTEQLYNLSDEEFAKLEQPRDEKGRFAAVAETPVEAPVETVAEEPVEETIYRREIDLQDGSGKQVFEAPSMEELIDKLATAQENATRKIRELSQTKKEVITEVTADLTEDEKWVLAQEMAIDPIAALDKAIKRVTGRDLSKIKTALDYVDTKERGELEDREAIKFRKLHPEYIGVDENADKMTAYMQLYKLPASVENFEKAFADLSESGLLVTQAPKETPTETTPEPTERRIAAPATRTVVVTRRAASGLSAKRSSPPPKPEPTIDELYEMPMKELEKKLGIYSE